MGNSASINESGYNTIVTGLDASGKTTIRYKISFPDDARHTIPIIGWNLEHFEYRSLRIISWDVEAQEKIRPLWRHFYDKCKAVIWVIDVNDIQRLHYDPINFDNEYSVHQELHRFLNEDELQNVILCILLNKKDLSHRHGVSMDEIQDKIGMYQYKGIDSTLLKSIIKHRLPNDIIDIIAEYTPNRETGPCQAKRIHIDDIFKTGLLTQLYSNRKICGIICSYLPPYKYINGSQKICKIFETCATSGAGLNESFNWVNEMVKASSSKSTKKDCSIINCGAYFKFFFINSMITKKNKKNEETLEVVTLEKGWDKIYKFGWKWYVKRIERHFEGKEQTGYPSSRYIETYDMILIMCIQREPYNYSAALYTKYTQLLNTYFSDTLTKSFTKSISFLNEWIRVWLHAKFIITATTRIFMYLDRFYVPNHKNEGALNTTQNGYISFYCNVFELYANNAKYRILKCIEQERKKQFRTKEGASKEVYDIITESLRVYVEIDQHFNDYKIELSHLPTNRLNIADMNMIIDGYFREMKSLFIPVAIIVLCKQFYGDINSFNLLKQSILFDLELETLNYYRFESQNWFNHGLKQYFMKCDAAIITETRNYALWISMEYADEINVSLIRIFFGYRLQKLLDNTVNIPYLFDIYSIIRNNLFKERLLNQIIIILQRLYSSKYINNNDSDITDFVQIIQRIIDGKLMRDEIYLFNKFIKLMLFKDKNKLISLIIAVYYHQKYKNNLKFVAWKFEQCRNHYIKAKANELVHYMQCP